MNPAIKNEIGNLVGAALDAVKPSGEDRVLGLGYAKEIALALAAAAAAGDPDERAAALNSAQGFTDALSMMVARYEVDAVIAGRKLVSEMLVAGIKLAIATLA